MPHKAGGKITSSHTTLIEAAKPIVNELEILPEVTKVTLGPIEVKKGSGAKTVKIVDELTCVCLTVTQNSSAQLLFVYTDDRQETKLKTARFSRNNGYKIRFGDRRTKGEG